MNPYLQLAAYLAVATACISMIYASAVHNTPPRVGFVNEFFAAIIIFSAILFGGAAAVLGVVKLVALCVAVFRSTT